MTQDLLTEKLISYIESRIENTLAIIANYGISREDGLLRLADALDHFFYRFSYYPTKEDM